MQQVLYGVYGGYYALLDLSFYAQVMGHVSPHDAKVYTWDLARALAEMQEYQAQGFDYVTLYAMPGDCLWSSAGEP